jgi:25S rRNA (uracil2634-N3)-methyltransferase
MEGRCGAYGTNDKILIVGDGNFSFSLALAKQLGSARNMFCTSYDSEEDLHPKYPESKEILQEVPGQGERG